MSRSPVPVHRVVVVGAGYAGLMAAARLGRSPALAVTLVEPSPVFIERIRLHQWAAGQRPSARPLTDLVAPRVTWVRARVAEIDLAGRRAVLEGGEALTYDQLVLAVGSVADRSRVPGAAEHGLSLQTAADCRAITAAARRGGPAAVVGLGLTGIEAACELAEAFPGLQVTLLGRGRLADAFAPAAVAHLRATLERLGVALREGVEVESVAAGSLALRGGATLACSLCVWAGGLRAPDLAARAGLPVAADGRVLVDGALRALGRPEVLVVGDAAHVVVGAPVQAPEEATGAGRSATEGAGVEVATAGAGVEVATAGAALRMSCAAAMPMGAHAAAEVLRRAQGLPAAALRYGSAMLCVSLGRREGLIQMLTPDDRPRPRVVRGRLAVFVKEAICRMTVVALRAESRGVRIYDWSQPRPAIAAGAAGVCS